MARHIQIIIGSIVVSFLLIRLLAIDFQSTLFATADSIRPVEVGQLIDQNNGSAALSHSSSQKILRYLKVLSMALPKDGHIQAMLGFCYYHLKDYPKALHYYKRAADLSPAVFWYHYGVATVYLLMNNAVLAQQHMARALTCQPQATIQEMMTSKMYGSLFINLKEFQWLGQHLNQGYLVAQATVAKRLLDVKQLPYPLYLF